jgi:hypothetical protein
MQVKNVGMYKKQIKNLTDKKLSSIIIIEHIVKFISREINLKRNPAKCGIFFVLLELKTI